MTNQKFEIRNPREARRPKTEKRDTDCTDAHGFHSRESVGFVSEGCISKSGTRFRWLLGARDSSRFAVRLPCATWSVPAPAAFSARSGLKSALLLCCLALSTLITPLSTSAQSYSIDWHTIDGGGGTSTGGVYSVSGTIGQPDASSTSMTGGGYSLTGGFWSLIAVQTPGAPILKIVPAGLGQATISWTPNTPDFVLQETLSLSPTNWVNSASGTNNPVTVPVSGDLKFYRLFNP